MSDIYITFLRPIVVGRAGSASRDNCRAERGELGTLDDRRRLSMWFRRPFGRDEVGG